MGTKINVGFYFYELENSFSAIADKKTIINSIGGLPEIAASWDSVSHPLTDPKPFISEIAEKKIEKIVLAGEKPGLAKSFFAKAMNLAGKDPDQVLIVNLQDFDITGKSDTKKAVAVIASAVKGISYEELAHSENEAASTDTLVIGGGIAGIQASLEIADSHHKVYLVEKSGTIGGHMAMFDKTFPTLDCAACILTPKMVDVGQHPYIDLMTYCEVKSVTGIPGNYKVEILQKARRVDIKTCTGCGTCAEKCPSQAKSEFDSGTTMRKAIYIPFPQAVPNKYLIDADSCRYVNTGKCGVCVKFCPVENCINLDEEDKVTEITVGNIVVATGFKPFDPSVIDQYGYGKFPNVLTSLELERLVNASGPTGGKITKRSQDKKGNWIFEASSEEPGSIAIIHCIGSRDENHHKYCSRVCCMYSLKLAHLIDEKIPDATIYEHYIDMRAYGKGYEEFYKRIEGEGVNLIRGKIAKIEEAGDQLLIRAEDIEKGKMLENRVDMVILAVGLEPAKENPEIADMLGINMTEDGWLKETNSLSDTNSTQAGGIYIAGTCQGPKDIPDSVVQASAAAAGVVKSLLTRAIPHTNKNISVEDIQSKANELSILNEA